MAPPVKKARDLTVGDLVLPNWPNGDRSRRVMSVRDTGGLLPIEVQLEGAGTWHYNRDDKVRIKEPKSML